MFLYFNYLVLFIWIYEVKKWIVSGNSKMVDYLYFFYIV